jgi:small subunit ribosomal protein S4
MGRYTGNKCKLCRREAMKLFLKGQRCFTDKCALSRRDYPPGQHSFRRRKISEYGIHLREKQKVKRIYGLYERQFKNTFRDAERMKGNTGENLLQLLERRLDNVFVSTGFALSRNHARQLVSHGHVQVNGRRVDKPSFRVKVDDVIGVIGREKIRKGVKVALEENRAQPIPEWMTVNKEAIEATITALPQREEIPHPIQEQLVVEICSR